MRKHHVQHGFDLCKRDEFRKGRIGIFVRSVDLFDAGQIKQYEFALVFQLSVSEGKVIVKILKAALLIFMIIAVSACGSAERKKNKAEARNTDEKTKTMQEYKSCIKKAKEDQAKLDACERLIKANE
jgi:hypothetical protein